MNANIELKEEITFDEYKAWLTGLLRGKGRSLPDLNDWKVIKKMTDKVVPDVIEVQNPNIPTTVPITVPTPTYVQPEPLPWWQTQPNCGQVAIGNSSIDSIRIEGTITQDSVSMTNFGYGVYGGAVPEPEPESVKSEWSTNKYTVLSAGFTPIKINGS